MAQSQKQPIPEKKQKKSDVNGAALAEKEQIIQDYTNTLKRLQADFENYMKRAEKEREQHQHFGAAKILLKFLDIADDFERANALIKTVTNPEVTQGLTMIHTNITKILKEEDVHPIPAVGQHFDPYKHEIIDTIASDKKEGTIIAELQKGYTYKDMILRTSKVRVAAPQPSQKPEEKNHVQS